MSRLWDWFVDHQFKIMVGIGLACTVVMFITSPSGLFILLQTAVLSIFSFIGSWLFETETTESWLALSWGRMFKNVTGIVLMAFSWVCFLGGRGGGVVGTTIASLLSGSN